MARHEDHTVRYIDGRCPSSRAEQRRMPNGRSSADLDTFILVRSFFFLV